MPPIELDPIPDPAYPEGSVVGNFDGNGNPYEAQELLHRPHAFALMHGDGGAKVAYGELHWRVDVFTLEFKQETFSFSANIDDHPSWDHTHDTHPAHTHEHDHYHTTRPHTHEHSHTHTHEHTHGITEDSHEGHTGAGSGSSGSLAGTGSYDGTEYTHDHGGTTGYTSHSTTDAPNDATTGSAVSETGSTQSPDEATTGNESSTLSHNTVTRSALSHTISSDSMSPSAITYCRQASQEAISQITQTVPKVDAEDGDAMDATIPSIYHQLSSYGDVYLVWDVDLELGAGSEITDCWVQVGAPSTSNIGEVALGNTTTNRRNGSAPTPWQGTYAMKLGTVNENDQIIQNVSSDVSWATTVMDRVKV